MNVWNEREPEEPLVVRTVDEDETDEVLLHKAFVIAYQAIEAGDDDLAAEAFGLAGELFDMQEDT